MRLHPEYWFENLFAPVEKMGHVEPRRRCTAITPTGSECHAHVVWRQGQHWCPVCGEHRSTWGSELDE